MRAHEVDYTIVGAEMQAVEITLDHGEEVVSEPGSMLYMDQHIQMETIFGDGSKPSQSFFGKLWSAGKRVLTGERLFMTTYKNTAVRREKVAFSSPYPGKIIPIDLMEMGEIVCQKNSFLCAARGVAVDISFRKRLGVGFFGGEGFIMQKLQGDGLAFIHAGGSIIKRTLEPGESLKVDTGCLVALTAQVDYDIKFIGGIKNSLFGGEGLFLAHLQGPGTVWLQTLPFSRLADRIIQAAPKLGGKRKGEGSVLGGLGDWIDGDN